MADTREFGPVIYIAAEALGQPGQRRFRLRALNEDGESAALWLEKEQLNALGDAIETVLKDEGYEYVRLPLDDLEPEPVFPLDANVEMRIVQLSMGVHRETQRVVLIGSDSAETDDPGAAAITLEFDYRRAYELRRQINEVVAAGRPPCPLCTAPMDPEGHVCVRSNGHNPH
jgi:uncharacterized repeat protein (TIGR03847 family)